MKKLILCLALLGSLPSGVQAGVILGTVGSPVTMLAGTTSGPLFLTATSDGSTPDTMAAWQANLVVLPDAGATGTVSFKDPGTGVAPAPPNYVFAASVPPGIT